ncbi:MAG: hypothetical protein V4580_00390 [Bacteroidota bacterium]
MARLIIPIGIDIETVKTVFGSKNDLLFEQVIKSNCFKKLDEEFSFKRELADIIFKYILPENRVVTSSRLFGLIKGNDGRGLEGEWNDYGYALLVICCHVGVTFSKDNSEFVYGDSWWQINTLLRTNGSGLDLSRMIESRQIFDTPFEQADIYTNFYSKKEVVEFSSHMLIMEKDIEEKNKLLFNTLKKGLLQCIDKSLDLVIFSYEI